MNITICNDCKYRELKMGEVYCSHHDNYVKSLKECMHGFQVENNVYLVRCPKCNKENYALCVADGICAWCGYDANKE